MDSVLTLTPAPQGHSSLRRRLAQPLWVLLAATGLLLGLACLNVAGLFLARGSARTREIATRLALGAARGRIGRQLLTDSLMLALAGGALGVALAVPGMRALIAFLPRDTAAHALQSAIDPRLLWFALGVSLAAGLLSGLAPALSAGRKSLVSSLRERGGPALGGVRLRKFIVTAQIAFSLVLLIGALLFVRTLTGLLAKGPGFDTSSLVAFSVDARRNGYSRADAGRLMRRIHDEIRTSPATQSAAIARYPLLHGGSWNDPITIQDGRRLTTERDVNLNSVTPEFFAALGIQIVAGRNFDQRDVALPGEANPRSAIINQAFANRYFAGRSPLGARIAEGSGPNVQPTVEIVGVMTDFSYRGLREQSEQAFFPFGGNDDGGHFYVKVRGTPEQAAQSLRAIVQRVDPALPIANFRTVEEQVARSLNTERILASISSVFGVLALVLSLIGLYGVMSFVVTRRMREIGIRMALGATSRSALWLVLRDALVMILAGEAIAVPCVVALGRLVESQLFGVTATDPLAIAAATLLLAAASIGAALLPAWRAATLDPTTALRLE